MNEYMDIILDRFCDDVNCTGEVYSATKRHLNKAWWEVEEERIQLHVKFDSGLEVIHNKDAALDFIGSCCYTEDF